MKEDNKGEMSLCVRLHGNDTCPPRRLPAGRLWRRLVSRPWGPTLLITDFLRNKCTVFLFGGSLRPSINFIECNISVTQGRRNELEDDTVHIPDNIVQ